MYYADRHCRAIEWHDKDLGHYYEYTGPCVVTGKQVTVRIPGKELFAYRQGTHIQDAMPSLSAEEREFLMSGISAEGWKQTFGSEEELDSGEAAF